MLLVLCRHPALSQASEASVTRRISRAKRAIAGSGVPFRTPPRDERARRLATVLHVLYLIFTEGYAATSGPDPRRVDLTAEAIRLTETVCGLLPDDGEVMGLLALMLLTDARAPARANARGELVPMREQDRSLWKAGPIRRGVELVGGAMTRGPVGPYRLQAAIAALHAVAPSAAATDWRRIVEPYRLLVKFSPGPDARLEHDHLLHAARAHLREMSGDRDGAREAYALAARCAGDPRHARYLTARARRLG
ncbi:sigma factor-like helix-turn-helix DNA-binding protein [Actinomadura kijaniata]